MADKFDLRKHLIENKATVISKQLDEVENEFDQPRIPGGILRELRKAIKKTGIDPTEKVWKVAVAGHFVEDPVEMTVQDLIKSMAREIDSTDEDVEVFYDFDVEAIGSAEELGFPEGCEIRFSIGFDDAGEYVIGQ